VEAWLGESPGERNGSLERIEPTDRRSAKLDESRINAAVGEVERFLESMRACPETRFELG
jgi:hypothetical protein